MKSSRHFLIVFSAVSGCQDDFPADVFLLAVFGLRKSQICFTPQPSQAGLHNIPCRCPKWRHLAISVLAPGWWWGHISVFEMIWFGETRFARPGLKAFSDRLKHECAVDSQPGLHSQIWEMILFKLDNWRIIVYWFVPDEELQAEHVEHSLCE